jgi:hypothetical protein
MGILQSFAVWFFGALYLAIVAGILWLGNLATHQLFGASLYTLQDRMFWTLFVTLPMLIGRVYMREIKEIKND